MMGANNPIPLPPVFNIAHTRPPLRFSGEVFAFGYDNRNRMVTVTDTATSGLQMQGTYVYDALNQRIEKDVWTTGGTTTITRRAFDNGQIWAEMNSSNALQMRYLRSDVILELLARISSGGTAAWLLVDRMGSLRNVIDNTGKLIDTISYDGFGNFSESNSANGGAYKYAGYRYDPETGLFLSEMSDRPYNSFIGRFTKEDDIGIAGGDPNLFRYCGNDAMNWIDPSGLGRTDASGIVKRPSCGCGRASIMNFRKKRGVLVVRGLQLPIDIAKKEPFLANRK